VHCYIIQILVHSKGEPCFCIYIKSCNASYTVEYTYSVQWVEENIEWKDRLSKYTGSAMSLPGSFEIHWLSVINSFVLVLLLTAFLTIIMLRILKNDFSRYMELDEEAIEEEEVRCVYWKEIETNKKSYDTLIKFCNEFYNLTAVVLYPLIFFYFKVGMEINSW
jgi:Endomembrane protein 70